MARDAEYWHRALAAFKYAKLATKEQDRAAWLRIAEGFSALFRKNQNDNEDLYHTGVTHDLELHETVSLN
ncbi:hypothetical protein [Bradyrhizobium sp. OAE829]|uniref:hypothetical protein n=1 Tax=Bradyrhizobium sp. OAE829 TaxID=2663807 RepID=UPI0017897823